MMDRKKIQMTLSKRQKIGFTKVVFKGKITEYSGDEEDILQMLFDLEVAANADGTRRLHMEVE